MSLQFEMVSCGDCKKCLAGGKVHGPYWYRYYREGKKMKSEYVGKEVSSKDATDDIPAGSTPEALFPEHVQQMRQKAEQDATAKWEALSRARQEIIKSIVQAKAETRRAYRLSKKDDLSARARKAATRAQKELAKRAAEGKAKLQETA